MNSINYYKNKYCKNCNKCLQSNQSLFVCLVNKLAELEKEKTELTIEGMK